MQKNSICFLLLIMMVFSWCKPLQENKREAPCDMQSQLLQSAAVTNGRLVHPEQSAMNSGVSDLPELETLIPASNNNPIDEYFVPLMSNPSCEAERRELQDAYRGVWKDEFENILHCLDLELVYMEDKELLMSFHHNVDAFIEKIRELASLLFYDDYSLPTTNVDRRSTGNGVRNGLNQLEAEIYRDICGYLLYEGYQFIERDYSKAYYE